jgi:hypothetical protein
MVASICERWARLSCWRIVALLVCAPVIAQAQGGAAPDECYGFSFDAFSPPLDYAGAGHPGTAAEMRGSRTQAPKVVGARESAIQVDDGPRDSLMILFPSWWPAGVAIRWSSSTADTLKGIAQAFVADGRVKVPTTSVRGWRIPCASR